MVTLVPRLSILVKHNVPPHDSASKRAQEMPSPIPEVESRAPEPDSISLLIFIDDVSSNAFASFLICLSDMPKPESMI